MNRTELVRAVSDRVPDTDVAAVLDALVDEIEHALAEGDRVEIRNFGTFFSTERTAYDTQHPVTAERVSFPRRRVANWRPASKLKERLT